jgi:uncharacterized Zn finger protein
MVKQMYMRCAQCKGSRFDNPNNDKPLTERAKVRCSKCGQIADAVEFILQGEAVLLEETWGKRG